MELPRWLQWKKLQPGAEQEKGREKVVVLIDFENLEENSKDDPEFKRLGLFLDYVAFQERKDIIAFEIVTPSSRADNAEAAVFTLYGASLVHMPIIPAPIIQKCPRNFVTKFRMVRENGKRELKGELKDVDTVDFRMNIRGKWFVDHMKELAEIVVVSNDGDFRFLQWYCQAHGIRFRLLPVSKAFSKDYLRTGGEHSEVIVIPETEVKPNEQIL